MLYDADCSTSNLATLTVASGQVTLDVSGATAGQTFIVAVKYTTGTVIGTPVKSPYPTVHYDFVTNVDGVLADRDTDGLDLKRK
jgi:hypothetical protein